MVSQNGDSTSQDRDKANLISVLERHCYSAHGCPEDPLNEHNRPSSEKSKAALSFAQKLQRLFEVPTIDAPRLCMVGSTVHPASFGFGSNCVLASATGKGLDPVSAILSCIGEASEYVSQHLLPGEEGGLMHEPASDFRLDEHVCSHLRALAGYNSGKTTSATVWTKARLVRNGNPASLPANLCYRNLRLEGLPEPHVKLGLGCGAGPTSDDALLHAMFELLERDAVALWWLGGRPGNSVRDDVLERADAYNLIKHLRGGKNDRASWTIDLTTDLPVPCIAALSCDGDGMNVACGFAAHFLPELAVRKAILEMCQMEMAIHLVQLKRVQQGDNSLTKEDYKHLKRCYDLDVGTCALLHPVQSASGAATDKISGLDNFDDRGRDSTSIRLAECLAAYGVEFVAKDLTRPEVGITVKRVLATGLQPMPATLITQRLQHQIDRTGGGPGLRDGVELL